MKRDWISKRAVKKLMTSLRVPDEYTPDFDNMTCVEGGLWNEPNGIARDEVVDPDAVTLPRSLS